MQHHNNRIFINAIITLAFLIPAWSYALEADRTQPVRWNSDGNTTTHMEGGTRYVEMKENVSVTQGTLEILGDEAVFEYDAESNELVRVTVYGSPVRYQQQIDEEGALVTGSSETVLFYRDENRNSILEFIGDARINSPDSSVNCAAIIYLADQDLIREATGPCQGTLNSADN